MAIAATSPPVAGHIGCITAEIDAATAWQNDKAGKYPKMLIIFVIRRDRPAFDDENGSDREALWQKANLMTHR